MEIALFQSNIKCALNNIAMQTNGIISNVKVHVMQWFIKSLAMRNVTFLEFSFQLDI